MPHIPLIHTKFYICQNRQEVLDDDDGYIFIKPNSYTNGLSFSDKTE